MYLCTYGLSQEGLKSDSAFGDKGGGCVIRRKLYKRAHETFTLAQSVQ